MSLTRNYTLTETGQLTLAHLRNFVAVTDHLDDSTAVDLSYGQLDLTVGEPA